MSWIEIAVEVDGESAEAVAEVLAEYGHQGVAIERIGPPMDTWEDNIPPAEKFVIKAYMPADEQAADKQKFLRDALRYMNMAYPMAEPTFQTIEETNWAEAWKVHYKPIRLGRRVYIRPSWVEVDDIQE
ncbi:MAG: 50S ribosomal protein L11 methyltransferase, partial [Anaerolineae bacterium]|nr:50S ribosomal protein L11 methyltransferase [Anaerolineae bacterium]